MFVKHPVAKMGMIITKQESLYGTETLITPDTKNHPISGGRYTDMENVQNFTHAGMIVS